MAYELSPIDRVYRDYTVTATLRNGNAATLTGVDAVLLAPGQKPSASTVWKPTTYTDGIATVLLAGPEADPTNALVVPGEGGGYIWLRVTDSPEVDAERIERINVS